MARTRARKRDATASAPSACRTSSCLGIRRSGTVCIPPLVRSCPLASRHSNSVVDVGYLKRDTGKHRELSNHWPLLSGDDSRSVYGLALPIIFPLCESILVLFLAVATTCTFCVSVCCAGAALCVAVFDRIRCGVGRDVLRSYERWETHNLGSSNRIVHHKRVDDCGNLCKTRTRRVTMG